MADENTDLMAHLMRRAGFGANREELETRVAKGYEATVEELLCPDSREQNNRYEMLRYHPWAWSPGTPRGMGAAQWFYAMISTARPLEEKIEIKQRFMQRFWSLFLEGQLRPVIDSVFPIEQAGAAQRRMAENRNIGKIVLKVS